MKLNTNYLHAHVYFDERSRASAAAFQERIRSGLGSRVKIYKLIDRPIGPHPKPMFEVDFNADDYSSVVEFLDRERGELDILVHQVTPDEVWDHTEGAQWLGKKQVLDMRYLQDFMEGKIREIGSSIRSDG